MKTEQNRAFIAIILSGIILFTWQFFFAPKHNNTPVQTTVESSGTNQNQNVNVVPSQTTVTQTATNDTNPVNNLKTFTLSDGSHSYTFDVTLTLKESQQDGVSSMDLFDSKQPSRLLFLIDNSFKPITFSIIQSTQKEIELRNDQNGVTAKLKMDSMGKVLVNLNKTTNSNVSALKFVFQSTPKTESGIHTRSFAYAGKNLETIKVGKSEKESPTVQWLGLDYKYYLLANSFSEKIPLNINTFEETGTMESTLSFAQPINYHITYTKKYYDQLLKMGENLQLSVNFGFFSFLAIPIFRALQFFYAHFPNYGIAIILLTLVIRMLTFPLQYKSSKSMKKMQSIQPELKKIQEKYKEDPQRLQKESMALFKRTGANPMSGCFPLLLQMPIFFAFYKVLYNTVELVGAPFYFWIHDLSSKDPYYVLPVLMTISMFFQQKLTPTTTADPTQKKVMMFMPLIFGFIMKDLPSGLNLYIFVSTMFAIFQQIFVMKKIKV